MQWDFLELNNSFDASIGGMIIIILWPFRACRGSVNFGGVPPVPILLMIPVAIWYEYHASIFAAIKNVNTAR